MEGEIFGFSAPSMDVKDVEVGSAIYIDHETEKSYDKSTNLFSIFLTNSYF
jgi:hypothetical protein